MEASASTAGSVAGSAVTVTPAAACSYTVRWPQAGVYDLPSHGSTMFKVKYANEIVTGPCLTLVREGNRWTAVYCGCDPDGRAWMRSDALLQR